MWNRSKTIKNKFLVPRRKTRVAPRSPWERYQPQTISDTSVVTTASTRQWTENEGSFRLMDAFTHFWQHQPISSNLELEKKRLRCWPAFLHNSYVWSHSIKSSFRRMWQRTSALQKQKRSIQESVSNIEAFPVAKKVDWRTWIPQQVQETDTHKRVLQFAPWLRDCVWLQLREESSRMCCSSHGGNVQHEGCCAVN